MLKYLTKRLFISIFVLLLVISLMFISFWYVNIEQYARPGEMWMYWSLIWDKYFEYIEGIVLRFDWGTFNGDDVWELVFSRLHYTLKINFAALLFFMFFGTGLGVIAAINKNNVIDKIITSLATVFSSIPSFVLVWFLMLTLGWGLQILPAIYPVGTQNPITALLGLVIPVLALSMWPLSKFIHLVRGEILENISAEYLLLARSKGLTRRQCIMRHMVKNTTVVVMPEVTTSFLFVLTSSFLVEIIYNVNGVANLFMDSLLKPFMDHYIVYIDVPVTILIASFYVAFGIVMSLFFDFLSALLDPRIKIGSNKFSRD